MKALQSKKLLIIITVVLVVITQCITSIGAKLEVDQ